MPLKLDACGAVTLSGTATGAAAGAASEFLVLFSLASSIKIAEPSETRSPTLTKSCLTVPATGLGISIEALSDSMVINDSSGSI